MKINLIKDAYREAIVAFKKGEQCYQCDFYNYPASCDMRKDETCETTLISRIFFAIKIFIIEYRYIRKHF